MQKLEGTEDLRVRRTRKLLQQAFIKRTVEKGFADLTVRDITEHAMVNRSTFYRHYLDKYDLLEQYINEICHHTPWMNPGACPSSHACPWTREGDITDQDEPDRRWDGCVGSNQPELPMQPPHTQRSLQVELTDRTLVLVPMRAWKLTQRC